MANRYAVQSGNWSDPATWDGGTLPGVEDDVYANGFTVDIDQDIDINSIATKSEASIAAGGGFVVSNTGGATRYLNIVVLDGYNMGAGGALLLVTADSGTVSLGTTTIYGGTGSFGYKTVSLMGTANFICGTIDNTGGRSGTPLHLNAAASVTIQGDVLGGGYVAFYVENNSAVASIIVTGNCVGGSGSSGFAIYILTGVNLTVQGDVIGGSSSNATVGGIWSNSASAIFDLQGAVIATNTSVGAYLSGSPIVRVRGPLIHAPNSRAPLFATHWAVHAGVNTSWQALDDAAYPNGNPIVLTNYVSDSPPPADVREGTTYGADSSLTGTMKVPPPSAVTQGVPVDGTVGTAALEVDDIASAVGAQIQGVLNG